MSEALHAHRLYLRGALTICSVVVVVVVVVVAASCVTIKPTTIGQKTSLEHQLMGTFEPLTQEELLAVSVRAPGALGALQSAALTARRRQLFNRDDVDEYKELGCLGEAMGAVLVARDCAATRTDSAAATLRNRLVTQEAQDRQAIIDWVITADPQLTPNDKPRVVDLYGRMLLEQARAGDWVQNDDGSWTQR